MRFSRKTTLAFGSIVAALAIGAGGFALNYLVGHRHASVYASSQTSPGSEDDDTEQPPLTVKVVHPKVSTQEFARTVSQPAYVQGFYQADILARVAGPVKWIEKNIGASVKEGEVLLELDVPELVQELAQKDALVRQAEQDARMAKANVDIMVAAEEEALANRRRREAEYARVDQLVKEKGAIPVILDESLYQMEAARANLKAFKAKVAAAKVDVDVKEARIAVAQAERAKAQAMVDFATIRAPFDGTIVARGVDKGAYVDKGTFVQNASTGHPMPLLTLVRTDTVTLVMWVPEKDAPYVTKDTDAVVHLDALGEREMRAKISRCSNWLDPSKSRDMRVEVDLVNPTKDGDSAQPGKDAPRLLAGMYGTMKLVLQRFAKVRLVPTSAVFERNGKTYVFEVKDDGKAHLVRVRVQLDDGVEAKVARKFQRKNVKTGQLEEVLQDFTGDEEIIRSGQGEIAEGQIVKPTLVDW